MVDRRIDAHPILGPANPWEEVSFRWKGKRIAARKGEPIAAALLAAGIRCLRMSKSTNAPRGVYCGIGHCMECRVTVDGQTGVRACLSPVYGGEEVQP
jgi:sarcosine oxidase subunit alpha